MLRGQTGTLPGDLQHRRLPLLAPSRLSFLPALVALDRLQHDSQIACLAASPQGWKLRGRRVRSLPLTCSPAQHWMDTESALECLELGSPLTTLPLRLEQRAQGGRVSRACRVFPKGGSLSIPGELGRAGAAGEPSPGGALGAFCCCLGRKCTRQRLGTWREAGRPKELVRTVGCCLKSSQS